MNWDRIEGNWRHLRGKFREQWALLDDKQLEGIAGKRERLIAALRESYGLSQDEVERRVKAWEASEQRAVAFEQVLRRAGEFA
jgi:uncharacterized protein YjbJ (UPF0337 family)